MEKLINKLRKFKGVTQMYMLTSVYGGRHLDVKVSRKQAASRDVEKIQLLLTGQDWTEWTLTIEP